MQAVANNPKFAEKVGVNQSVGQEFTKENSMKTKKMNMGGRAMNDRDGSVAMDPRMQMAMAAQQKRAAAGGMKKGGKVKKMRRGGNTSKMNELEELGRVDAEKGYSTKGKRNLKDEKARVVREIKNKKAGGKVGYKAGGKVKKMGSGGLTAMGLGLAPMAAQAMKKSKGKTAAAEDPKKMKARMKDKEGRAMASGKFKDMPGKMKDARGRAMKTGGMLARTGGSSAKMKAKGKAMKAGGTVKGRGKASKRADGIARQGRTRGRIV